MKWYVVLILFALPGKKGESQILFQEKNFSTEISFAQKAKKPVLLYFHFTGCAACVDMEKNVFTNDSVINFYNNNFHCLNINILQEEGKLLSKKYKTQSYPTFIYLNDSGQNVHKIVGFFSVQDFIRHGNYSLIPGKQLRTNKKLYASGNRNPEFLYDYIHLLDDASELNYNTVEEYLNKLSEEELSSDRNIKLIYQFAVYEFKHYLSLDSKPFRFLLNNKNLFYQYFDTSQVDVRIYWTAIASAEDALKTGNFTKFEKSVTIMQPYTGRSYKYREPDGRITGKLSGYISEEMKLNYYSKFRPSELEKVEREIILANWNNSEALNELAWNYYEKYNYRNKARLEAAKTAINRAIELNESYANYDTYAAVLYKLREYENALKAAEQAIIIAKQNNESYSETISLIEKIKRTRLNISSGDAKNP